MSVEVQKAFAADPSAPAWPIGCNLKVMTTFGETLEGTVFTYDKVSNVVVLEQKGAVIPGQTTKSTFRMVKANFIKQVVSVAAPSKPVDLTLLPIDMQKVEKREEEAVRQAEEDALLIGVGVTADAQELFDTLVKTLPCRWEGKSIVLMDDIVVKPPYKVEDCSGGTEVALERVRMMVGQINAAMQEERK